MVVPRDIRQSGPSRSVGTHDVDLLIVRTATGHEGDAFTVRRPSGFIGARGAGEASNQRPPQSALLGAVGVHHGEPLAIGIGSVSNAFTIGRPSGPVAVNEPLRVRAVGTYQVDRRFDERI